MGNLCSIFHSRFKNLIKVIPSARKAQLVDYILLGWQNSTYKLKGSENKWFMKPYSVIVEDTGIPKSTLERYLKELNDDGFIERRQALYCRNKNLNEFEVKKGGYISITEKLLKLLIPVEHTSDTGLVKNIVSNSKQSHQVNYKEKITKQTQCEIIEKNEGIDCIKMRGLYIRDLYSTTPINNITQNKINQSVDKSKLQGLNQQFESIQQFLYTDIKEEVPIEVKKLILGTFFNLTFDNQRQFSAPKQLAAEYLFALLNVDFYLPHVVCFKHRNNILSKMVRMNQWRTPKGFYKHFYLGKDFKDQHELREQRWKNQKELEKSLVFAMEEEKDERLIVLESQMFEKSILISELTQALYQQSSKESIIKLREQIQNIKNDLENLWVQQALIEQENNTKTLRFKRCA
jgi:DNA-binding Lrp family transcriptional regulator